MKIFTLEFFLIAWQKQLVAVIKHQQNDLQIHYSPVMSLFDYNKKFSVKYPTW